MIVSLVAILKFPHILMKALTMLIEVVFYIRFKEVQLGVRHVKVEGHSETHLLVGLVKIANRIMLVYFFVVTPNALNN